MDLPSLALEELGASCLLFTVYEDTWPFCLINLTSLRRVRECRQLGMTDTVSNM